MSEQKSPAIHIAGRQTLHIPGKRVYPGRDEFALRCSCGSMRFRVFMVPDPALDKKWARCGSIVCLNVKCQRVIGVTPEGILDTDGEAQNVKREDREL